MAASQEQMMTVWGWGDVGIISDLQKEDDNKRRLMH
jgi:hypothetical protein